jgi:thiol-disulfide isomerase/thioredoxin
MQLRLGIGLSLAAVVAVGSTSAQAAPVVGKSAPALVATELDGTTFDLAAERGKVTIVNFWATWCGPCRIEMPRLNEFYRKHHAEGIDVIGLSVDRTRDIGDVRKIMQAVDYPAALSRTAKANGFGDPRVLPITYIVDATGVLKAVIEPDAAGITEQKLDDLVLPLLHE